MKTLFLILAISAAAAAQVYKTPAGKSFHARTNCVAFYRGGVAVKLDSLKAVKENLKPCGNCYRVKKQITIISER